MRSSALCCALSFRLALQNKSLCRVGLNLHSNRLPRRHKIIPEVLSHLIPEPFLGLRHHERDCIAIAALFQHPP